MPMVCPKCNGAFEQRWQCPTCGVRLAYLSGPRPILGEVGDLVLEASQGALDVTDHLQAQLVTWEVTGLAMLAGSALAGAGTPNCLKQGLCVGLAVSAVLLGFRLGLQHAPLPDMVLTVGCSLALGLAGAWFGGSLFPPLIKGPVKGLGPEAA
jgi:hypothetical protein